MATNLTAVARRFGKSSWALFFMIIFRVVLISGFEP